MPRLRLEWRAAEEHPLPSPLPQAGEGAARHARGVRHQPVGAGPARDFARRARSYKGLGVGQRSSANRAGASGHRGQGPLLPYGWARLLVGASLLANTLHCAAHSRARTRRPLDPTKRRSACLYRAWQIVDDVAHSMVGDGCVDGVGAASADADGADAIGICGGLGQPLHPPRLPSYICLAPLPVPWILSMFSPGGGP